MSPTQTQSRRISASRCASLAVSTVPASLSGPVLAGGTAQNGTGSATVFLELSHGQWAGNGTGAVTWSTALFDASAIQCTMPTLWLVACSLPVVRTLQSMVDAGTITVLVARSGIVDYCGPSMSLVPSLQLTIPVKPGAQLASLTSAVQATGTATAAIATVSSVAGVGAAGDAQTLAVLGSLSCSPPAAKKQTSSLRYMLSPFVDFGNSAMVLGNVGIVAVITIFQGLVIIVLVRCRRNMMIAAMGAARFPSLTLTVSGFLYQGTVFAALQLIQAHASSEKVALGIVALLLCIALPIMTTYHLRRYVLALLVFRLYPFSAPEAAAIVSVDQLAPEVAEAQQTSQGELSCLMKLLLPIGYWDSHDMRGYPMEFRRRFGRIINSFKDRKTVMMHAYPQISVLLFNVAAAVLADASCDVMYAMLISILLGSCVFVLWFAPHRSTFLNVTSGASFAVLALVCVMQVAQANNIASDQIPLASGAVSFLQLALILARAVYDVALSLLHPKWEGSKLDKKGRRVASLMGDSSSPDDRLESMPPITNESELELFAVLGLARDEADAEIREDAIVTTGDDVMMTCSRPGLPLRHAPSNEDLGNPQPRVVADADGIDELLDLFTAIPPEVFHPNRPVRALIAEDAEAYAQYLQQDTAGLSSKVASREDMEL